MFKIYYYSKGKIYCDICFSDNEKDARDGFEIAHFNDRVLLINIERI